MKLTRELTRTRHITDETFAEAEKRFGASGVVELIATAAYYSMLAYVHNALLVGR